MRRPHSILIALLPLAAGRPSLDHSSKEITPKHAVRNSITELYKRHSGEQMETRQQAGGIVKFPDEIPDCDKDPSFVLDVKSRYQYAEGAQVPTVQGLDAPCLDAWGEGEAKFQCRTEYWIAETQVSYTDWVNTTVSAGTPDCLAHTRNPVRGLDWSALETDFVVEGRQVTFTRNKQAKSTSICLAPGDHQQTNSGCKWQGNDNKCHRVWESTKKLDVYGYVARVCSRNIGNAKGNQQNTKIADDRWVRGMADFRFSAPIGKQVGCEAECADQEYPAPTPPQERPVPFDKNFFIKNR
ncbi:hypothetical protein PG999_013957 [Apiospora kogelbergensis]|uniref:Uncharacterized protein n=1 Tax=Apiospora kogelbergensis TaxID=1337665 RepID=A0AAW0QGU5_9PEZI